MSQYIVENTQLS